MAKLHNYYVLCPLIDQKSFLGVSQDKEEEIVIVTLGRNVANKYRLSDQKQICGWTSKDHITSTVVYDKEQSAYVGVFNRNTIKIWKEDSENLDKVKKHKFSTNIFRIIPRDTQSSLIIFNNGHCAALPYALDNRKSYESKLMIKDSDTIVDTGTYSVNNTDYICYIVKNAKESYEIIICPLRDELGDMDRSKLSRVKIAREDVYVVGQLVCTLDKPCIYVLWSDSKMTTYDLIKKTWKTVGSVPWISTTTSVSLAWMGENHLILFGTNTEQDGAIIVAYNIILGVGSCRYPMKMYSEDAKIYCFNSRIVLEASNHVGMLPYLLETDRNLSSLMGSHEIIQDDCTEIADWGTPTIPMFKLVDDAKELLQVGLTERNMCIHVIPPLLEKKDFKRVFKIIKEFKDVPESVIVLLLNYIMKLLDTSSVDVTNRESFNNFCLGGNVSNKDLHQAKFELLNYIFQIPFSDALLIPYMRNGMTLEDALFLISYISFLLVDSEKPLATDYESRLFDWCTLLVDAFYQQYLMTKDDKVTSVLETMHNVINKLIKHLLAVNEVLPLLNLILSGKQMEDNQETLSYTLELMEI